MLRVGFVQYINSLPLYAAFQRKQITTPGNLTYAIPSKLNALFSAGELDISLISTATFLKGDYESLPYGIVAKKEILSVNLYVRENLPSLDNNTVALTHHSATSIALLKLLCRKFWRVKPHFIPLDRTKNLTDYSSFLLIGDEALKQNTFPGYTTIDLAEQWHKYTHLPFVFALFAVQKEVMQKHKPEVELFTKQLSAAHTWGHENATAVASMAQEKSALSLPLINTYFSLCSYSLGPQELKSIDTFAHLIDDTD